MGSTTVCLAAKTLHYQRGGGHLWVYLNWALGLKANGCQVTWLEAVMPDMNADDLGANVETLRRFLEPYGLADSVALCSWTDEPLPDAVSQGSIDLGTASDASLLLNVAYGLPPEVVARFGRSALLDIDPGLLQTWMASGQVRVAPHDLYFTTGETVGRPGALFPDCGLEWTHLPPCVSLEHWPTRRAQEDAPFTTVTHWHADEWVEDGGEVYLNDKRTGFLSCLDLPALTGQPLELALCLAPEDVKEWAMLRARGWTVRHAWDVSSDPWSYQRYVQRSRGEFSCVKPSCVRLQNAWVSDRTLCYLASGKPAVVQHTGPSRLLPDSGGLFRFRDVNEAAHHLEIITSDYARQCRLARELAETHFDARHVAAKLLDRALS